MDKRVIFYFIFLTVSFYFVHNFLAPKQSHIQSIPQTTTVSSTQTSSSQNITNENLYVLENKYQQLVFSDVGGSLAEINLPLKSTNNDSIILPIEFDKILAEKHHESDLFPQKQYYGPNFVKKQPSTGGYYPLLRRSIYNNGNLKHALPQKYYALNIYKDNNNLSDTKYKVVRFEKNLIEFENNDGKRKITKTYFLNENDPAPYILNCKIKVDGKTDRLWVSSGLPEVELTSNAFMPALKCRSIKSNKNVTEKISLPKTENIEQNTFLDWTSNSNGFFGIIIDPLTDSVQGYKTEYVSGVKAPSRITIIDSKYNLYPASKYPAYAIFTPLVFNNNSEVNFRIFAGPYQDHILTVLDKTYDNAVEGYTPNYTSVKSVSGFLSFASEPFVKFLLIIMRLFYSITHSWGFSIILLTIAFRVMLYPLNSWSIKSTMQMQEITPLLKVIDAKYKKDPQRANLEKIKLFKEKGANPISGCLPILIQFPFLIGMFNLLKNSFDLRGVGFIPGWINNLTSPDILFSWNRPIVFLGNSFHLLPLLLGIVMFIQSKMNMKKPEGNAPLTDQQKQQQIMLWAMPVLFTVLFYKAASGLNIYFFFSMLLGIVQQWYMGKKKNSNIIKLVKNKK